MSTKKTSVASQVHAMTYSAQIRAAVVELVAVDVIAVAFIAGLQPKDFAVHPDLAVVALAALDRAVGIAAGSQEPAVLGNPFAIRSIHSGVTANCSTFAVKRNGHTERGAHRPLSFRPTRLGEPIPRDQAFRVRGSVDVAGAVIEGSGLTHAATALPLGRTSDISVAHTPRSKATAAT